MLIVTPAVGSVPEPRPQALITGDRAIQVLDTVSSTALQNAGIKKATVSLTTYTSLITNLIPEVFDGLDPATGQLKDDYLPSRLSPAAINALNVTGLDGKVASQFLPDYLTPSGISTLLGASSTAVIDTDPDGTPVVIGGNPSSTDATYTGTVTAATLTAGTTHGDLITGTISTISAMTSNEQTLTLTTTEPGAPLSTGLKVYADTNGRVVYKDSASILRRASTIRTVTTLPSAGESFLGDQCIVSATGEHRIYKGATLGWRLASQLVVNTKTDRDALTGLYSGMTVYCTFGVPMDHVYKGDSAWHGTKTYLLPGAPTYTWYPTTAINDTNSYIHSTWNVTDPGFAYFLQGKAHVCFYHSNVIGQVNVDIATYDSGTTNNKKALATNFYQIYGNAATPGGRFVNAIANPQSGVSEIGSRDIKVFFSNQFANSGTFTNSTYPGQSQSWVVVPL